MFVSLASGEVIVYQREAGELWLQSEKNWPFSAESA